jgi:hypothetical protein
MERLVVTRPVPGVRGAVWWPDCLKPRWARSGDRFSETNMPLWEKVVATQV